MAGSDAAHEAFRVETSQGSAIWPYEAMRAEPAVGLARRPSGRLTKGQGGGIAALEPGIAPGVQPRPPAHRVCRRLS